MIHGPASYIVSLRAVGRALARGELVWANIRSDPRRDLTSDCNSETKRFLPVSCGCTDLISIHFVNLQTDHQTVNMGGSKTPV
jgi:hypothetical protein